MRKIFFLLIVLSCISVFSANYVLLIGNSAYFSDPAVKNIPSESMVLNLKNAILQSGYAEEKNLSIIMDGSKESIKISLNKIISDATSEDSIFVYYTGFRIKSEKDFYYSTSDNSVSIIKGNLLTQNDYKSLFHSKANKINIIINSFEPGEKDGLPVINSENPKNNHYLITSVSEYASEKNTGINGLLITQFNKNKDNKEIVFNLTDRMINASAYIPEVILPIPEKKYGLSTKFVWKTNKDKDDKIKYDLYFGTEKDPVLFASDLTAESFQLEEKALKFDSQYYLRVVSKDSFGNSFTGETISFKTTNDIGGMKILAGTIAPWITGLILSPSMKNPSLDIIIFGMQASIIPSSIAITGISNLNGENSNVFLTGIGYFCGSALTALLLTPAYYGSIINDNYLGLCIINTLIFLCGSIGANMLSSY